MLAAKNYRKRADMRDLAIALKEVPPHHEAATCAFITDNDLMRPQWWVRALLWIARLRRQNMWLIWVSMETKSPGMCRDLIDATAQWIVTGCDRVTKDAAGGFNQGEVDLLQRFLASVDPQWSDSLRRYRKDGM